MMLLASLVCRFARSACLAVLAAFVCFGTAQAGPIPADQVEAVYVFGDSLVDVGNAYAASGNQFPPSPPYTTGRFSNGPLWIENLLAPLAITLTPSASGGNDFGFGGASSGFFYAEQVPGGPPTETPGLLYQVSSFVQPRPKVSPNALYFVSSGANDLFFGGVTDIDVPVNNLTAAINTLYAYGARRIAVANLPDLGQIPLFRSDPQNALLASTFTRQFNRKLDRALEQLRRSYPDLNLILLDFNSIFAQAIADPASFGFTNTSEPCLVGSTVCTDPDAYLFWDDFHPTAAAGRVLADFVAGAIFVAPSARR